MHFFRFYCYPSTYRLILYRPIFFAFVNFRPRASAYRVFARPAQGLLINSLFVRLNHSFFQRFLRAHNFAALYTGCSFLPVTIRPEESKRFLFSAFFANFCFLVHSKITLYSSANISLMWRRLILPSLISFVVSTTQS